jgi:hypothetical protein
MKKYRSLWGKSTTNHNRLYFNGICGIRFLNTRICLWKVRNRPAKRGIMLLESAPFPVQNQTRIRPKSDSLILIPIPDP